MSAWRWRDRFVALISVKWAENGNEELVVTIAIKVSTYDEVARAIAGLQ